MRSMKFNKLSVCGVCRRRIKNTTTSTHIILIEYIGGRPVAALTQRCIRNRLQLTRKLNWNLQSVCGVIRLCVDCVRGDCAIRVADNNCHLHAYHSHPSQKHACTCRRVCTTPNQLLPLGRTPLYMTLDGCIRTYVLVCPHASPTESSVFARVSAV